jgi:hypothetical protein
MTTVAMGTSFARRLVESEARRSGNPLTAACRTVASRLKCPPGAIWSLVFRAPKRINADLLFALQEAVEREIKREIGQLENELLALGNSVSRVDPRTIAEVEEGLAALRSKLRGAGQ